MSEEQLNVLSFTLARIIENQITIKEHLGIIVSRDTIFDDEYSRDHDTLVELSKLTL